MNYYLDYMKFLLIIKKNKGKKHRDFQNEMVQ